MILMLYHAMRHGIITAESFCHILSEIDDEDCERRRMECLDEMADLEKQFLELKEK